MQCNYNDTNNKSDLYHRINQIKCNVKHDWSHDIQLYNMSFDWLIDRNYTSVKYNLTIHHITCFFIGSEKNTQIYIT